MHDLHDEGTPLSVPATIGYRPLPMVLASAEAAEEEIDLEVIYEDTPAAVTESKKGDTVAKVVTLAALSVTLIQTWTTVLTNSPVKLGFFALHLILQTIAVLLFVYGILILQPTSQLATKTSGLRRHQQVIAMAGIPVFIAGTCAILINKTIHGHPHLQSWHAIFGLLSLAWLAFQVALGGGSVWFEGRAFGGGARAKVVWKYHRLSGYILLPLLLLTVHTGGAWSGWVINHTSPAGLVMAYTLAPITALAAVFMRVRTWKMKFF